MSDVDYEVNLLLEELKLSEDAGKRAVVDVHLEKISSNYCREWFRLYPYLDIKAIYAEDIDDLPISPQDKRYRFLKTWKKLKGNGATYRSLIKALLEIGNREDAENIGKLLLELPPAMSPQQQDTTCTDTALDPELRRESSTPQGSTALSPRLLSQSPVSSLPSTTAPEDSIDLSYFEPATPYEQAEVEIKVKELQSEFNANCQAMLRVLRAKGVTFESFTQTVTSFPGHSQLSTLKSEAEAVDVEEIWGFLNKNLVLNFLDFYMLERIVNGFGSDLEKQSIYQYSKKLTSFRRRATVSKLLYVWNDIDPELNSNECTKLMVHLDWDPDNFTLAGLEKFRKRTYKLLNNIPHSRIALVLCCVKIGSVNLVWIVNDDLVSQFKTAFAQCERDGAYFKKNDIIGLKLDGQEFKSMERRLFELCECATSNVLEVNRLLEKWDKARHNINELNKDGKTPLILATERGYASTVVSLLEAEADIKIDYQTENTSWSALFFAYNNGHLNVVKLLLEYGANSHLKDKRGKIAGEVFHKKKGLMTRFKSAMSKGSGQFKKLLQVKKKTLWAACEEGDYATVRYLLKEEGHGVNMKNTSRNNWTPLHYACNYGHFEVAQLLVESNTIIIDAKASNGWTPLALACYFNYVRIANLLLKSGAKCNEIIDNATHYTSILLVTNDPGEEDVEPLASSLLKYGADLNMSNKKGWTPLMIASDIGRANLVRLYLECGADPNSKDQRGWTALMSAAKHNEQEVARILLENGADAELAMTKTSESATEDCALHVACYKGSAKVVRELVEHGVDPNKTNGDGLTPLMIAANQGRLDVVEGLMKSGKIDVNLLHKDTRLSALIVARKKNYPNISECLLRHGARDDIDSVSVASVASREDETSPVAAASERKLIVTSSEDLALLFKLFKSYQYEDKNEVDSGGASSRITLPPYPADLQIKNTPLSLKYLTLIKWKDEKGHQDEFRLADQVSSRWRDFGKMLELPSDKLDAWNDECLGKSGRCWDKVMQHWLDEGSEDYPVSWEGLYGLLKDTKYYKPASQLLVALKNANRN